MEDEKQQKNYAAAMQEYSAAVKACNARLLIENGRKPDQELIRYLIDRREAKNQAGAVKSLV